MNLLLVQASGIISTNHYVLYNLEEIKKRCLNITINSILFEIEMNILCILYSFYHINAYFHIPFIYLLYSLWA